MASMSTVPPQLYPASCSRFVDLCRVAALAAFWRIRQGTYRFKTPS
jgi:hypothetical protein